jgi:hypothetical protein
VALARDGEEVARVRVTVTASGGLREEKTDVRLKRLRSAFHAMTERAGRLTGRGGAASGQSPISSWHDRTCPV